MNIQGLIAAINLHQKQLRMALVLLLALLCVYFLVLSLKTLLFSGPIVQAEINLNSQAAPNPRWTWYRTEAVVQNEPEQEEEELAIANINAELLGVVIAGSNSVATITVARRGAEVFKIDDEIDRNVTLVEVEPHRVIISQAGVRRQLLLKDLTGNASRNDGQDEQLIRVNNTQANSGAGFTLPGVGSTLPVNVPGEGMGLRLNSVSSEIADLADLNDGDVVMDINGTPVSDLFTNPLLWQQFSQETSLPMTVIRDGEREEVYVNAASLFERIIPQLDAGLIQ